MKEEERNEHKSSFYLMIGPQNSGKTTFTYRLYSDIYYQGVQVSERNLEEVKVDRFRLRTNQID